MHALYLQKCLDCKRSGIYKVDQLGYLSIFFQESGHPDDLLRALWIQEVTRRGVLILTTFNPTAVYTEKELFTILNAFAGAFKMVGSAVASEVDLASLLDGPIPTPAFKAR